MKVLWRVTARFYQIRAARARAAAGRFEVQAEKFFARIKGLGE
ncbi:hypothetical protein [Rhodovulum sp. BSW8]|nr:hypothetical protein [Rhodovulum sp. BSW8]